MMIQIDTEQSIIHLESANQRHTIALGSVEGFELLSKLWLRAGWDTKHVYSFTWLGRPIIQLPEDVLRLQEVIWNLQPDVIVETGVAHGGGLIFYASLCRLMGKGRIIGVDIEIRPHNRAAIEAHPMASLITLIEGSSVTPETIARVKAEIQPGERVLVLLDSNHTRDHVRAELEAYAPLVSLGSYIVATDGIMMDLVGAPRSQPDWGANNPNTAAREFAKAHPEFVQAQPGWRFNESLGLATNVTYWPGAWLRRTEA